MQTKIEFQVENARLVEKAIEAGIDINTYEGWKANGRYVMRGERQVSVRVRNGSYSQMDPITGAYFAVPKYSYAYGFMRKQTLPKGK